MAKKMLVDASHPEETRVVVLDGNRVEEFDYESASRRPLKGNIYLAKVTRVEPSLQACFVEYGGNRHGFLAFSEIHPDYYQIPTADRQALLAASRAARRHEDDDDEVDAAPVASDGDPSADASRPSASSEVSSSPSEPQLSSDDTPAIGDAQAEIVEVVTGDAEDVWVHDPETDADAPKEIATDATAPESHAGNGHDHDHEHGDDDHDHHGDDHEITPIEAAEAVADESQARDRSSGEDAMEELPRRDHRSMRRYKIQEVIKRRQVLLVQVVKEERGNKGAALTTYLSLAGRYCVLMPNTDRGGGISRKISNVSDRRKLKELAGELEVPEGMGVIIRTAGANRTKQEIQRDFEYLLRQWDAVRDLTLRSSAPTLVYEEGNLIKRTIRDLYSKDVDDVLVEGDQGFDEAHSFMTMLMPSHANSVKHYQDHVPLFQRYGVEAALDSMFNPIVRLRSGGYIVINQTEALVAIDVNSGKATREHHIEDTALKTNLEAAEEIARQLRLRDLAGLVVIDFIDMEEHRNNRSVEKRLKDSLRHDRARIQLGRISPFGLLEMSRQRLRAGMVEGATIPCPHCEGRGVIRSVGSMALRVLRAVEEYCQRETITAVTLRIPPEIALYILNHKRAQLTSIEDRHGVYIYIESKASLAASTYEIERGASVPFEPRKASAKAVTVESELEENDDVHEEVAGDEAPDEVEADISEVREDVPQGDGPRSEDGRGGRRRRRRRGRGRDRDRGDRGPGGQAPGVDHQSDAAASEMAPPENLGEGTDDDSDDGDDAGDGEETQDGQQPSVGEGNGDGQQRRRRRRGRRGRRGRRDGNDFQGGQQQGGDRQHAGPSPIGHLPTPADALDAPDWPSTGGYDTTPGERPPVPRNIEQPRQAPPPPKPEPVEAEAKPEPRAGGIASFFGFGGTKSEEAQSTDDGQPKPERKGWWKKSGS